MCDFAAGRAGRAAAAAPDQDAPPQHKQRRRRQQHGIQAMIACMRPEAGFLTGSVRAGFGALARPALACLVRIRLPRGIASANAIAVLPDGTDTQL